jgi:hypothetical protein
MSGIAGPIVVPPTTGNFRDTGDALSPSWWNGPNGQRLRYAMNVCIDGLADGAGYAVLARFPDTAPFDAFPWLAIDRQIDQGFAETTAHYIGRLKQWLDLWAWAGMPAGLLLALLGYVSPVLPTILTVATSVANPIEVPQTTTWNIYMAGTDPMPWPATIPAAPTFVQRAPGNWQWDSAGPPDLYAWGWWRVWVVLFSLSGSPWPAPTKTWGSFRLGDGTCLGWAGTYAQAAGFAALCRKWKAAHCQIPFVIVCYDSTMFDNTQAFGSAKLPDGNWGRWGKVVGGVYVPARPLASTCSFITGA